MLTVAEAAKLLGVSPKTLRREIDEGVPWAFRVRRALRIDGDAMLTWYRVKGRMTRRARRPPPHGATHHDAPKCARSDVTTSLSLDGLAAPPPAPGSSPPQARPSRKSGGKHKATHLRYPAASRAGRSA